MLFLINEITQYENGKFPSPDPGQNRGGDRTTQNGVSKKIHHSDGIRRNVSSTFITTQNHTKMKLIEINKNEQTLKSQKVKIHPALWVALCPVCKKKHHSASERSILPTLVFCDHSNTKITQL